MNVNTQVYGLAENWQPQFFRQRDSENQPEVNKCPSFNNNNYSQLYYALQNNRVNTSGPIDISISYCALGEESASSHRHSIVKTENNEINILSSESELTNFFFWERTGNSLIYGNGGVLQRSMSWYGNVTDGNINAQISPYCSINVHNQVLGIRVWAMNAAKTAGTNFQLSEYLNNYQNYPHVVSVYLKSYNGYQTPRDSNMLHGGGEYGNIKFGMGLLNPYKYSDNTDIYNYAVEQDIETSIVNIHSNMAIIMGSMCAWQYANISENNVPVLKAPDLTKWSIEFTNENYNRVRIYQTITQNNVDEFFEECLKQAACFGLYFSPKETVCINGDYTNEDMYIGILESGIGHGKYLKGAETVNAPQNEYENMNENPYDAHNPPNYDNTKYTNGNSFRTLDLSLNSTSKFYVLTDLQLPALASELYTIMADAPDNEPIEKYNTTVFLTRNPIDSISSIKRFPVPVPHFSSATQLKIGSKNTNISAYTLNKSCGVYYFDFNNSDRTGLYPTFGKSFLDYEPYTKININVPFCGTFDVPCNYFHNYGGVTIALIIDFITGAATALLLVDGNVIDSLSGSAAIDIPLTGLQSATIDSQIYNASLSKQKQDSNYTLSMLGGAAAITLGVASGGAAAIIGGAAALAGTAINKNINDKSLNYELSHMQAPVKQVSAASSSIGQFCDMRCKMIISRPEYADNYNAEVYANTIGFACLLNGKVSEYSGLTIGNIELDGVNCTAAEKDMIKAAFINGVYL